MNVWNDTDPIRLLITGAAGQVGYELAQQGAQDGHFEIIALDEKALDVTSVAAVRKAVDQYLPDYVINTAAFNKVDAAQHEQAYCLSLNRDGIKHIAQVCGEMSVPVVHLSTDYVFDGHYASGYGEEDDVSPMGVFAQSKWEGEEALRQHQPHHIILRISWIFSARGHNYLRKVLERVQKQQVIEAADDRRGCPTSAADVARVILAIVKQIHNGADAWGTYHYCSAEVTTRYRFTEAVLAAARQYQDLPAVELHAVASRELYSVIERPASSILKCKKILNTFGIRQRPWRSELAAVVRQLYQKN